LNKVGANEGKKQIQAIDGNNSCLVKNFQDTILKVQWIKAQHFATQYI
jgi:hypothetical protein